MLYIAIESETMHFFFREGEKIQRGRYRMHPALNFEHNLRKALASMPAVGNERQAVRVLVTTPGTAMPLTDFSEEICEEVFRQCFVDRERQRVFYDMIPETSGVWIFGMPKDQCEALEGLFGEVFYASSTAPLTRYALQQAGQAERLLLLGLREEWVDVVAVQGSRLLLVNTYPVHTAADAAYYGLSVAKQLNFNLGEDRVILVGADAHRATLKEQISRFVRNIEERHDILRDLLHFLH